MFEIIIWLHHFPFLDRFFLTTVIGVGRGRPLLRISESLGRSRLGKGTDGGYDMEASGTEDHFRSHPQPPALNPRPGRNSLITRPRHYPESPNSLKKKSHLKIHQTSRGKGRANRALRERALPAQHKPSGLRLYPAKPNSAARYRRGHVTHRGPPPRRCRETPPAASRGQFHPCRRGGGPSVVPM